MIRSLPTFLLAFTLSGAGTVPCTAVHAEPVDAPAKAPSRSSAPQTVTVRGDRGGVRFDGIGLVNSGGATAVLLKDYPEPQRSQILDLVFKPKFGASISALLAEIPGDGNSTQGSMPSHMRTREDVDFSRGYIWWILTEAKKRNPALTLDGTAWSAPGWVGQGNFWSQDAADYYVKWLQGLRDVYGLRFDALGCRNEKGVSLDFAKRLRATLDGSGFADVKLHAFDNWPDDKFDFVRELLRDPEARAAIDILSAHVMYGKESGRVSQEVQELAARLGKPIWNTEDHVYKKGFDCEISIVECFNRNFIESGATKIVNWYDIAGVYPIEPYSEDPATILAHSPWSGHYDVREALWGYAHYGQFTAVGWTYLPEACGTLKAGGTLVVLKSPENDYSIIIETKAATEAQALRIEVGGGLSTADLCVWRSNAKEQFTPLPPLHGDGGVFSLTLEPASVYSLSTTRGQQKGAYGQVPAPRAFPFPYRDTFDAYRPTSAYGHLPRYFADIEEVFELTPRPDGKGVALRQAIPVMPNAWAPSWHPYTIIGDADWRDYEVSCDVYLTPGDTAGILGRVNDVGTGYGTIPKGYVLQLTSEGQCELVVVRGKKDKKKPVGDAEQRALIQAMGEEREGGEKVLVQAHLPQIRPGEWHTLRLKFEGTSLTGFVDDVAVVQASDALYDRGMAGLFAGAQADNRLSRPFYDDFVVKPLAAATPAETSPSPSQTPIYRAAAGDR